MKIKGLIDYIILLFIAVLFIIFDWYKFDLAIKTNRFVIGNLTWIVYIIYGIIVVWTLIYAILNVKKIKWRAITPAMICLLTILYICVYPLTGIYKNIDYASNYKKRIQIVEMYENHQLTNYQISQDEYMVPYRSASHTGTMLIQETDGVVKIMFYVRQGFKTSAVLVYASDDNGIHGTDFNFGLPLFSQRFSDVKKIDVNWYSATININS